MGATTFERYADGADAAVAFHRAHDLALHEHGHGGYSRSLADKTGYVVITHEVMTYDDAAALANTVISRRDPRIDDETGPVGAIPIKGTTYTINVRDVPVRDRGDRLNAADLAMATDMAHEQDLLADGETVIDGCWTVRTTGPSPSGIVRLAVIKSPDTLARQRQPNGWLFFGWVSK